MDLEIFPDVTVHFVLVALTWALELGWGEMKERIGLVSSECLIQWVGRSFPPPLLWNFFFIAKKERKKENQYTVGEQVKNVTPVLLDSIWTAWGMQVVSDSWNICRIFLAILHCLEEMGMRLIYKMLCINRAIKTSPLLFFLISLFFLKKDALFWV